MRLTFKQLNVFKPLPESEQHTNCTRCNYMGCNSPKLLNHLKFIAWLHWNIFNPIRLYKRFKYWLTEFNYSKIDSIEIDGIDHRDYPDYCDAFIAYAEYKGKPMNDRQLDRLNENSSFVYDCVIYNIF